MAFINLNLTTKLSTNSFIFEHALFVLIRKNDKKYPKVDKSL